MNDYMLAINGITRTIYTKRELIWQLELFRGESFLTGLLSEYDRDSEGNLRLSDRYAEFLKKNRIKYYDRLCGFEREQYLSGYGFMQGYFDIDKVLEQLKKEGFAKVLFLGSTIPVNMTNVWTDAIWKSQKFRKGEHIMKKEHSKYQWIIGICCSENDGVKLYKYTGTVKKMKKRLLRLIKEDKKNDKENWESGSETVAELSDESNGEETCFCGYGSYSYYHIDYMAERVSNIEELSNCE